MSLRQWKTFSQKCAPRRPYAAVLKVDVTGHSTELLPSREDYACEGFWSIEPSYCSVGRLVLGGLPCSAINTRFIAHHRISCYQLSRRGRISLRCMECPPKSRLDQGQGPVMNPAIEWEVPSSILSFAASDIHIWRASLDLSAPALARLEATLGHDEKSRAARFVHARDRDHFIAARGILRELLGAYLKQPADQVQFQYGKHGKPRLAVDYSETLLTFNLSHSHGLAACAISNGLELGIDVELIRPEFAGQDIAARYFSEDEMAELRALPIELRADGFFRCWTRKEAYVKARGEGLSIPLDSFSVSLTPGQPDVLRSADSKSWTLRTFAPEPKYIGAVVGHGQNLRFSYLAWRE